MQARAYPVQLREPASDCPGSRLGSCQGQPETGVAHSGRGKRPAQDPQLSTGLIRSGEESRAITPPIRAGWGSDHRPHGPKRAKEGESVMAQEGAADKPLTPKQEAFVSEYLIDLNATAAAGRAGYSDPNIGRQLITKANVAARIAQARGQRAERAGLDAQTVLEGLLIEARGEGPDTTSAARTGAWKLIGQHVGMFAQKVELTGANGGPVKTASLTATVTPDELEGLDAQALARLYFGGKP